MKFLLYTFNQPREDVWVAVLDYHPDGGEGYQVMGNGDIIVPGRRVNYGAEVNFRTSQRKVFDETEVPEHVWLRWVELQLQGAVKWA